MRKFIRLRWLVLLIGLIGIIFFLNNRKAYTGEGLERTGTVRFGELIQRVTIAGNIVPNKTVKIKPSYEGYLKKVYVSIGDRVKRSDPIISVVPSLQSNAPAFPLRAPFSGIVVHVKGAEGEYATPGGNHETYVRIDDFSRFFVMAKVPEIDLLKIRTEQETSIKVAAILDRVYKGLIREISLASIDGNNWRERSTEYEVKVELMDFDEKIHPGMSAIIDVTAFKKSNILILAHEFIEKRRDGYFVTLSDGREKKIVVGKQNESAFEIVSGLKEGDLVRQVDFLRSDL